MPTPKKRKKVSVRVAGGKKTDGDKMEIDLKSAVLEEIEPTPAPIPTLAPKKAEKIKVVPAPKSPTVKQKPSPSKGGLRINLYRKIAYSFIILTLALLAVIFYFSFVKVTIAITPVEERVSNNLVVDVYDQNKTAAPGKASAVGAVDRIEIEETKNYPASGRIAAGEETTGMVTIINNYNKSQPLVATTRILSADNKLFRLKNTVNVPAGGSVEAEVYADDPGPEMALEPTTFTIPGLWAGLQDKIYAESKTVFAYNQDAKKIIAQEDIDAGLKDLRSALIAKAEKEIAEKYKDYNKSVYVLDENSVVITIEGKAGEEKNEVAITMAAAVGVAAFNKESVEKMVEDKLNTIIASDKKLLEFNKDNISYSLESHNLDQGIATVNAVFEGKTVFRSGDEIVDREKIAGLTRDQLTAFLDSAPGIASYEIKFQPSFIKKVPTLADRVEITINN
jgi:hypothetical protein